MKCDLGDFINTESVKVTQGIGMCITCCVTRCRIYHRCGVFYMKVTGLDDIVQMCL